MKVAIFGATGIVGRAITEAVLQNGNEVTILTRNASKVKITNPKLNVVEGSVTNPATLRKVIKGKDAVIQSLGIGGKGNGKPTTFVSDTNELIIEAMKAEGVKRYIAISAIGAGESWYYLPWIYRKLILPVFQKWFVPIINDKNRMEAAIENSDLDWTIIRLTTVRDAKPTGHVTESLDGKGLKFSISAHEMGYYVAKQLSDKNLIHRIPTISN